MSAHTSHACVPNVVALPHDVAWRVSPRLGLRFHGLRSRPCALPTPTRADVLPAVAALPSARDAYAAPDALADALPAVGEGVLVVIVQCAYTPVSTVEPLVNGGWPVQSADQQCAVCGGCERCVMAGAACPSARCAVCGGVRAQCVAVAAAA
jgi:hypothetical protein